MSTTPDTGVKPVIPAMRILLYAMAALVLPLALLFFLPGRTETLAAWTINPPLTAAAIGGAYLAAFFLELLSARRRVWAEARIGIPGVLIFATLALWATLLHLDRFHFAAPLAFTRFLAWLWTVAYVIFPIAIVVVTALQVRRAGVDPARTRPLPGWFRGALTVQGSLMVAMGALMFVAPAAAIPLWPWQLTPLTSRILGAWGVGIGVAALQAVWENDWTRLRPLIVAYTLFGALQLVNLARFATSVDWSRPSAWLYALLMLSVTVTGAYGWQQVRRLPG